MQLGSFFPAASVIRDASVSYGFPPGSTHPGSVCYALNEAAINKANANENVSAIITLADLCSVVAENKGCVISKSPQLAFYQLHNALCLLPQQREPSVLHPSAFFAPSAALGLYLSIGAGVRIGAHAVIEDYTAIGDQTWIGPHAVIGGRGLQDTIVDGKNVIVECAGGVRIGARCEILSGALIQRPYLFEFTEIGNDTKVGPGASIGHSAQVGRASMIGAGAVVAGNCRIGNQVWIGAGAVISDAVTIGDGARVQLGSVVVRDVGAGEVVSGNFALPHAKHLRSYTRQRHEQ